MTEARRDTRVAGKTIRLTWTDGPTKGSTHEHVFHDDGSVSYRPIKDGQPGKETREKAYSAARIADDIVLVSYLSSSGYTLTFVLDFKTDALTGVASNDKEWYPTAGSFQVVG